MWTVSFSFFVQLFRGVKSNFPPPWGGDVKQCQAVGEGNQWEKEEKRRETERENVQKKKGNERGKLKKQKSKA